MTQLEKIKIRYDRAKSNYLAMHPTLTPVNIQKVYTCGICGKKEIYDITSHMDKHNQEVPEATNYFLSLPYERVNQLIQQGKRFIKVLTFTEFAVQTEVTPFNALNFKDNQKLIDCNDVKIKWSAKSKQFKKYFFGILVIIILTF